MKEKVLEAFNELGFQLERTEETGWYEFMYEGNHFIYFPSKDDEAFLSLSIPGIYDLEEEHIVKFVALTEKLNSSIKYVKAYKLGDSLWLFYERELLGEEDLKLVISRMILRLDAALYMARKFLLQMDEQESASADAETLDSDDMK